MNSDNSGGVYTIAGRPFYSGFWQHSMHQAKNVKSSLFNSSLFTRSGLKLPAHPCGLSSTRSSCTRNYLTAWSVHMDFLPFGGGGGSTSDNTHDQQSVS